MSKPIYILNGPNLNLLGVREPEIYGSETLADAEAQCREAASEFGLDIRFEQSNAEHQIVDWIQEARTDACAIVINPAAFTHTSVAIHDALKTCDFPIFEVHVSNVARRESWRDISYVSFAATGVMMGFGVPGYALAVRRAAQMVTGK